MPCPAGAAQWILCLARGALSERARENQQLGEQIREFYLASGGSYGSPRIHKDLLEAGTACGENRVARLMKEHGLKALRTYKRPRYTYGKPSVLFHNHLEQQFTTGSPDEAWATDITYSRTSEGWLYLAVVLDLYSRMVVGWSMKETLHRELALAAILMAVWRRRPKQEVIILSDQGLQYGSDDRLRFCRDHR